MKVLSHVSIVFNQQVIGNNPFHRHYQNLVCINQCAHLPSSLYNILPSNFCWPIEQQTLSIYIRPPCLAVCVYVYIYIYTHTNTFSSLRSAGKECFERDQQCNSVGAVPGQGFSATKQAIPAPALNGDVIEISPKLKLITTHTHTHTPVGSSCVSTWIVSSFERCISCEVGNLWRLGRQVHVHKWRRMDPRKRRSRFNWSQNCFLIKRRFPFMIIVVNPFVLLLRKWARTALS